MISPFPSILMLGTICFACLTGYTPTTGAQAPVLDVRFQEDSAQAGDTFEITYEVSWEGEVDEFAIVPGEVAQVPWGDARMIRTSTRAEEGAFLVAQVVEYVPHEPGEFEVPSFVVGYFDPVLVLQPQEGEDSTLPEQAYLRAAAFTISVRRGSMGILVWGSALALIAALSLLGFWRARGAGNPQPAHSTTSVATPETIPAAINLARQHRLDGHFYGFYKELSRGASLLPANAVSREVHDRLERVANEVGYKGARPTDDEMDGALKDLERAVQRSPIE